jgi:hypothetical protein
MVSGRTPVPVTLPSVAGNPDRRGESPVASPGTCGKVKKNGQRQKEKTPVHQGGAL